MLDLVLWQKAINVLSRHSDFGMDLIRLNLVLHQGERP